MYTFGLIGHNISYSKSTDVFQAIFSLTGKKGTFEIYDIPPESFPQRLQELVSKGIHGFSVSIPYKKRIIEYLSGVDTIARALEAVNSVVLEGKEMVGFNTDCYGFAHPLRPHSTVLKHGSALIIGCGGAARAAVYSLYTDFEVKRFTVLARRKSALTAFRRLFKPHLRQSEWDLITYKNIDGSFFTSSYDIIVNCTPVGGWNYPDDDPFPEGFTLVQGKIYYDVNYNPDNALVTRARQAGVTAIDGSAMLVGQAIRSYDVWTGETVPFEAVYDAVFARQDCR